MVNRVIKVLAKFENTGAIDSRSRFEGEVYHEDEFVDTIESKELLVEVGENKRLTSYYKITTPGDYVVKGHVLYEGKESEEKEVSFTVSEIGEGGTGIEFGMAAVAGVAILVIVAIVLPLYFLIYKKKR